MTKTIKNQFRVVVFFLGLSLELISIAQERDSLNATIGSGIIVSKSDFNPFYLVHNRWGTVKDNQDAFITGELSYSKIINKGWNVKGSLGFRNKYLREAYLSSSWKNVQLYGGRTRQVLGGLENNNLTTGSLATGRNSLPIPQIGIEIDYFSLPLSYGYVKLKGGISHGWFETDRYISKPLLHQKYAKVLIDLDDLIGARAYSSLIHFAQYGGVSPVGDRQPSSFNDFVKVFFGQGIPNPLGGTAGESNAVGNHVGITEWTWDQRIGRHRLQINYQKPFEDQGSMQYISFKDFLVGLRLQYPEDSNIKSIYFEWIRTMSQSGAGLPDPTDNVESEEENFGYEFGGRDDYYNNWLYQTGWTYNQRILSNPLFLTYNWALNFLPNFPNYNNQVINNRISAFHLGALVDMSDNLSLRGMLTYSVNYGTYAGLYEGRFAWNGIKTNNSFEYVFLGGKKQFYSLMEANYMTTLFGQPVVLSSLFAFDSGELYNNVGMELSIQYILISH